MIENGEEVYFVTKEQGSKRNDEWIKIYDEIREFIGEQKLKCTHGDGTEEILSYNPTNRGSTQDGRCDLYSTTLLPVLQEKFKDFKFTLVKVQKRPECMTSNEKTDHTYISAQCKSTLKYFMVDTSLSSIGFDDEIDNYVGEIGNLSKFLMERCWKEGYLPDTGFFSLKGQQEVLEEVGKLRDSAKYIWKNLKPTVDICKIKDADRDSTGRIEDVKKLFDSYVESYHMSNEDLFIRAVKNGNIEEFDKLINIVDINHQDHLGNTALHWAVMRPSHRNIEEGSEENRILMLRELLGHDKLNTNLENVKNNDFKKIIEKNQKSNNKDDIAYGNKCYSALKPKTRLTCSRRHNVSKPGSSNEGCPIL